MARFPTFSFPSQTTQASGAFSPAQIDFSKIAQIADSYHDAQNNRMKRDAFRDEQAARQEARARDAQVRQVFAGGIPKDAQGNPDYNAMSERLMALDPSQGVDFLKLGSAERERADSRAHRDRSFEANESYRQQQLGLQREQMTPSSVREYQFYAQNERGAGREPIGFNEWTARSKESAAPSNVREWQYFSSLSPEEQQQYLTMKRANQMVDLGDRTVVADPMAPGQARGTYQQGIKPDRTIQDGRVITLPGVPGTALDTTGAGGSVLPQEFMPPNAVPGAQPHAPGMPQVQELPPTPKERREMEKEEAANLAKKRNARDYARTVTRDIGVALGELDNFGPVSESDTILGGYSSEIRSNIPRTPEYNMRQFVESALSNITLDTMNRMRETSAAGATGFGNMSDRQLAVIKGVLGQWQPGLPVDQQRYILHRLSNFYMDVIFGSREERNDAVRDGRMTQEEADSYDQYYYPETRDVMGRPNSNGGQSNNNQSLQSARDAIARGAPREAVIQRLRENGIDPSGL